MRRRHAAAGSHTLGQKKNTLRAIDHVVVVVIVILHAVANGGSNMGLGTLVTSSSGSGHARNLGSLLGTLGGS